jgi:hypothetical protein
MLPPVASWGQSSPPTGKSQLPCPGAPPLPPAPSLPPPPSRPLPPAPSLPRAFDILLQAFSYMVQFPGRVRCACVNVHWLRGGGPSRGCCRAAHAAAVQVTHAAIEYEERPAGTTQVFSPLARNRLPLLQLASSSRRSGRCEMQAIAQRIDAGETLQLMMMWTAKRASNL